MGREAGYTTVLKLLQIMTEKRLVAGTSRRELMSTRLRIQRIRHNSSSSLICSIASSTVRRPSWCFRRSPASKTSPEELAEIRKLIDTQRGGSPMNAMLQIAGWTLIHFVWQGAAIAVTAAVALRLTERRSSNARYLDCMPRPRCDARRAARDRATAVGRRRTRRTSRSRRQQTMPANPVGAEAASSIPRDRLALTVSASPTRHVLRAFRTFHSIGGCPPLCPFG